MSSLSLEIVGSEAMGGGGGGGVCYYPRIGGLSYFDK